MQQELFNTTTVDPLAAWCVSVLEEQPAALVMNKQTTEPELAVRFNTPPTLSEAEKAWSGLRDRIAEHEDMGYVFHYLLTFNKPVTFQYNRRKTRTENKIRAHLFISTQGNFCYTFAKRSGYQFTAEQVTYLRSIEPILPENALAETVKKVKSLANRIHRNAWTDLKQNVLADPESFARNYGATVTSITGKFPEYVLEQIKEAFENKTAYSYRTYGTRQSGRDLSVEVKLGEDGIFRAWFSSEYPGCGNGDYWILANPTTAIFRERD